LALGSLVLGRIGGGVGMLAIMSPPPPGVMPAPTTEREKKGASGGDVRGRARAAMAAARSLRI